MEQKDIKVGDVVTLNSNPEIPMTVYNTHNLITCQWFTSDGKLHQNFFLANQLSPYEARNKKDN